MDNQLHQLNLPSLEWEYAKVKKEIKDIRKQILNSLKIDIQEFPEENTAFVATVTDSISELNKRFSKSELVTQLSEKDTYLKKIIQELEKRKKELFDNLDMHLLPLDKLSTIESFLSKYQTPSYIEKKWMQIDLTNNSSELDLHTDIRNLSLNTRTLNCLIAADIHTLWDILEMYNFKVSYSSNKKTNSKLSRIRNLWLKSIREIEDLLRRKNLI